MDVTLHGCFDNTPIAVALALIAVAVGRWGRRPALAFRVRARGATGGPSPAGARPGRRR